MEKVIFLGNGPLATSALEILQDRTEIIFQAHTKADLDKVVQLKHEHPDAHAILASFGVIIPDEVLAAFEPEGILNLHPSKLPLYRGPSPIESAILAGDTDFSYSIMKLVSAMDAGPVYHQETLPDLPLEKAAIYHALATAGAKWLVSHLAALGDTKVQDDSAATYTRKLSKADSYLQPEKFSATQILRQVIAYQGFPKAKYEFYGKTCIILAAHLLLVDQVICDGDAARASSTPLMLRCADRNFVVIDRLQPEGKKPMTPQAFLNGYART